MKLQDTYGQHRLNIFNVYCPLEGATSIATVKDQTQQEMELELKYDEEKEIDMEYLSRTRRFHKNLIRPIYQKLGIKNSLV